MADGIFLISLAPTGSGMRPATCTKHYQNRRDPIKNQHPSSILSTGLCVEMNLKILSLFLKKYLWLLKDGDKSLKPENLEAIQSGEELFVTEMHWMGSDGCIEGVQGVAPKTS